VFNFRTISGGGWGIAGDTVNVTNSGIISGKVGIQSSFATTSNANVTNSGTIIGTGGTALLFSAAADTLTLLPGSRIFGAIDMGGGADVVNFLGGGRDISQLITLSNFTGVINAQSLGQPFVVTANQIATLDPTLFAMADRTLMDFSFFARRVVGDPAIARLQRRRRAGRRCHRLCRARRLGLAHRRRVRVDPRPARPGAGRRSHGLCE
jgi:hypothetical protein